MGTLEDLLLEGVAERLRGEYPDAPEPSIEAAAQLLCTARAPGEEQHVLLLLDSAGGHASVDNEKEEA